MDEIDIFTPHAKRKRLDTPMQPNQTNSTITLNIILDSAEKITAFRKQHRIRVYGHDIPPPISCFQELLAPHPSLASCLHTMHITEPTPIQLQAIPILQQGRDIMGCAPTGSGKTLAFLLPFFLAHPPRQGKMLILEPTRELAQQVYNVIQTLNTCAKLKTLFLSKALHMDESKRKYVSRKYGISFHFIRHFMFHRYYCIHAIVIDSGITKRIARCLRVISLLYVLFLKTQ